MDQVINAYTIPGVETTAPFPKWDPKLVDHLLKVLADQYQVKVKDIIGHNRKQKYIYVRHLAMYYLAKTWPQFGHLTFIGNCMDRDHTTVLYAIEAFQERLDTNAKLPIGNTPRTHTTTREDYSEISKLLNNACRNFGQNQLG